MWQLALGRTLRAGELAQLCRRLATMLEAGVDIRRTWAREAERPNSPWLRQQFERIRQAVADGSSLCDALRQTDGLFPRVFLELVDVGEKTGRLPETFKQLALFYEEQVCRARSFRSLLAGPIIELVIALVVIGLLIWILGIIGDPYNPVIDPLGFGVVGTPGLIIYLILVGSVLAGIVFVLSAARRGLAWARPIQRLVIRIPAVGPAIETLLLSRIAWTMHMTFASGMDVREAMRLVLRSTHFARYTDRLDGVLEAIGRGESVHDALSATGVFPGYFLDAVHTGEQAGRLPETMEHLSGQLNDQATAALKTLTTVAGWMVWVLIAGVLVFFIFRLAFGYIGMLYGAMG